MIPPEALEEFARKHGLAQAIFVGWVGDTGVTHVVTWGDSLEDSAQASQGGNFVKKALGFPDALCRTLSPRVAKALLKAGGELLEDEARGTALSLSVEPNPDAPKYTAIVCFRGDKAEHVVRRAQPFDRGTWQTILDDGSSLILNDGQVWDSPEAALEAVAGDILPSE